MRRCLLIQAKVGLTTQQRGRAARDKGVLGRLAGLVAPAGIGYFTGRRLPALYNGGCEWARYWQLTIIELRDRLVGEGKLDNQLAGRLVA